MSLRYFRLLLQRKCSKRSFQGEEFIFSHLLLSRKPNVIFQQICI